MTNNERELLKIVRQVMADNPHVGFRLGGSLALTLAGLHKRRETHDIDIIIKGDDTAKITIPDGWTVMHTSSAPDCDDISFRVRDKNTGISIDFLTEYQPDPYGAFCIIDDIPCVTVHSIIEAKRHYTYNVTLATARKHWLDIVYLLQHNPHYDFGYREVAPYEKEQ